MSNTTPGIYVVAPGHWRVITEGGSVNDFTAPSYDLSYLLRAYRDRLSFCGAWEGDGSARLPTVEETVEHIPEPLRAFATQIGGLSKVPVVEDQPDGSAHVIMPDGRRLFYAARRFADYWLGKDLDAGA